RGAFRAVQRAHPGLTGAARSRIANPCAKLCKKARALRPLRAVQLVQFLRLLGRRARTRLDPARSISLLTISHYTVSSDLDHVRAAHHRALLKGGGGLRKSSFDDCRLDCWLGEVSGLSEPLPSDFKIWECRNNRLAWLGLHQDGFWEAA